MKKTQPAAAIRILRITSLKHPDVLAISGREPAPTPAIAATVLSILKDIKAKGQTVFGLGASTKFNAVLQYCDITPELLPMIGEVNEDKFGCETPGSAIPIVPEKEIFALKPDYLVVGPYHFKDFLLGLPHVKKYLAAGGKLIIPLPSLEIVSD